MPTCASSDFCDNDYDSNDGDDDDNDNDGDGYDEDEDDEDGDGDDDNDDSDDGNGGDDDYDNDDDDDTYDDDDDDDFLCVICISSISMAFTSKASVAFPHFKTSFPPFYHVSSFLFPAQPTPACTSSEPR